MSHLAVDLDALAELADRMQRFEDHLTLVRDEADRRVAGLHATWAGEAAQLQQAAHRQWSDAAGQLQDALATLRSIAITAHANYSAAVAANRRMWQG